MDFSDYQQVEHLSTYLIAILVSPPGNHLLIVLVQHSIGFSCVFLIRFSRIPFNILDNKPIVRRVLDVATIGSEIKASASNAGNPGLIPGLGRSPGEGNGNPLQYSCLENPMDGGAW